MSDPFVTGPGYEIFNIVVSGAQSTQLSADETRVYIATDSGDILVFDLATRTLIDTISVAAELGSLTLGDDGMTAYVIGAATAGGENAIYEVNLSTGASSVLANTTGLGARDIELIDNGQLLISGTESFIYNLATGQASGSTSPGFTTNSIIVESDGLVLIQDIDISSGAIQLYDETQGRVVGTGAIGTGALPRGFGNGVMAVSREAGLIAVYVTQEGLKVYDLNFNLVFSERFFGFFEDGFAFSSDGSFLLALSGDRLTSFDTTNWQPRQIFDMSASGLPSSGSSAGSNGDAVVVTSDDRTVIVTDTITGVVNVIMLAQPLGSDPGITGTEGDDEFSVVIGQDVDGLGGTDRLSIDFRSAEAGVTADFRGLADNASIVVEGGTISNIENIQRIDGSEFDDFIAIYQDFPIGDATINGYGGDDEIIIEMAVGSFGAQVFGGDGNDLIDASGVFQSGSFYGGAGDDTIFTSLSSQTFADGGDGNDTIRGTGTISGGAGNDAITIFEAGDASGATPRGSGGDGDDIITVDSTTIFGSADGYMLEGGAGADTITGGIANDFITSTEFDSNSTSTEDTGTERDTLIGGAGVDHLFAGFGDNVDGGEDFDILTFSLAGSTSGVTFNSDELLGGSPIVIGGGTIQNIEAIDRLYGTAFDDVITVGAGSNPPSGRSQIFGNAGNDTFMNVAGSSDFHGGDGNDRYIVLEESDFSSFFGGDGIDTIDHSQNSASLTVSLSTSVFDTFGSAPFSGSVIDVENIEGGSAGDNLLGSFLDNVISGNGGNDVIDGGYGNDTLSGGAGIDEVQFLHGLNGVIVSLAITGFQDTLMGIDTLSGFENLTGSNFADRLTGDALANVIEGRDGDDIIDGGEGDDVLRGGNGVDEVNFRDATGAVTVNLAITTAQNTGMGMDTITGFENVTGSQFSDTLTGNALDNIFNGLGGDDLIDGGAGRDIAVFNGEFGEIGVFDVVETQPGRFTVTGAGTDTLEGIEVLWFDNVEVLLDLGTGLAIDPGSDDPDTFMVNIRDYDGNDLGFGYRWTLIGQADANLDGSVDYIFVNDLNGRFAEVGVDLNGVVQFDNHGAGGDTRVVGIYIDPLVESGEVEQGSDFDSQRRFQNDLFIGNIESVLGSEDYDGDGFAEIYFALTDGTAYLRAIMHADGNIQYANYQSEQQVIDYLTANGYDESTYGDWFSSGPTGSDTATFVNRAENTEKSAPEAVRPVAIDHPFEAFARPVDELTPEFFG